MRSSWIYLWLLVSALVVAVISWQAVAATHPLLPTPEELVGLTQPSAEQLEQKRTLDRTNDTYALTIFGALCMAAGAPLYARGLRLPFQIASVVVAVVIGALTGAAMGGIGFYLHDWMPMKWDGLVRVAVRWMAMLLPTGIAAALLTIVCQRAWRKSVSILMGGIIGSVFAGVAYALVAAVFLQLENTDSVLPVGASARLLLFTLAPLLIWIMISHQEAAVSASSAQAVPKELEAV